MKFKVPVVVIDAVNRRLYAIEYKLNDVGDYPNILYDFLRDHGGSNDGD